MNGEEIINTYGAKAFVQKDSTPYDIRGETKTIKTMEKCKNRSEKFIEKESKNPDNYPYDMESKLEKASFKEIHRAIWKRRQLTNKGDPSPTSPCNDKGNPVYMKDGTISWGPWVNSCEKETSAYKTKSQCRARELEPTDISGHSHGCRGFATDQVVINNLIEKDKRQERIIRDNMGNKSRVNVEYKVKDHVIQSDDEFLCNVVKIKRRDFPPSFTEMKRKEPKIESDDPVYISLTPVKFETIEYNYYARSEDREETKMKFLGRDGTPLETTLSHFPIKKTLITGDMKDTTKIVFEENKNFFSWRVIKPYLFYNGFFEQSSGLHIKKMEYERETDYHPDMFCGFKVSESNNYYVVPHYSTIHKAFNEKSIDKQTIKAFKTNKYTIGIYQFNRDDNLVLVRNAPRNVIYRCNRMLNKGLRKAKIEIKNYPDKVLTAEDFKKMRGKNGDE